MVFALACSTALADSIGVIGPVYPIAEQSALAMIMDRLNQKKQSGEMDRLEKEAISRSIHSVKNMPPVQGIALVTEKSARLFDPTVTVQRNITTDEGQVVVPAGTRVNPLATIGLSKRLVFFDGRDPDQVGAVRRLVQRYRQKVKPILVAGSWWKLSKAWQTQVYYDQNGVLSQHFGIKAVPSVISQQGLMLLIQELPAEDLQ